MGESESKSKAQIQSEILEKCGETLNANSSAYVIMLQVDEDYFGQVAYGGNLLAAKLMSREIRDAFDDLIEDEEIVAIELDDDGEDTYDDGFDD